MRLQSNNNQRGEIEFRRKLVMQQVEGKPIFVDEFDANGIEQILKDRMNKTLNQMSLLKEKDIVLSPYIEIGAERCQRSLVMENDIGANGVAVDISYDMLKSCNFYKGIFEKSKVPNRICCDANKLPFLTDSVPFVFCYETLHHFPDPTPIIEEIYRVLSPGGCFFFDEEPYKQVLHVDLYKARRLYSEKSLRRGRIREIIDCFLSENVCNEVEYGIIENHRIPLRLWKKALDIFEGKDVELSPIGFHKSNLFNPIGRIQYWIVSLLGGTVSGICRKSGESFAMKDSIQEVLLCPSCQEKHKETIIIEGNSSFSCPHCASTFPVISGVLFLFTYHKFEVLYPEIFKNFKNNKRDNE